MASSEDLDQVKLALAFCRASAFILSSFGITSWMARLASCMSSGSYSFPLTPSVTTNGTATARGPTTAMPAAWDSMKTRSKVPVTVGDQKMSAEATSAANFSPVTTPGIFTSARRPISSWMASQESPWPMMAKRHSSGSPSGFTTFTKSMILSTCFSGDMRPTKSTNGRSGRPLLNSSRIFGFFLDGWKNSRSQPVDQNRTLG
mmetsp:Transcript_79648/g.191130  ORF Transcript_79648/g.191130 Transcript_79648/m.191130 type:complete len:203 (-) Transcript_79648:1159-1767(-)